MLCMDSPGRSDLGRLLTALGERLAFERQHVELVVIGGAALTILGFVDRTTRDVDVVALLDGGVLAPAKPLPPPLIAARNGSGLNVHFAGRLDQIHFKLYAFVDQGAGRHELDLKALTPTREELVVAARWTRTHDPSEGFREQLEGALRYLGVGDVDLVAERPGL